MDHLPAMALELREYQAYEHNAHPVFGNSLVGTKQASLTGRQDANMAKTGFESYAREQ
jgi:hypothetical protein